MATPPTGSGSHAKFAGLAESHPDLAAVPKGLSSPGRGARGAAGAAPKGNGQAQFKRAVLIGLATTVVAAAGFGGYLLVGRRHARQPAAAATAKPASSSPTKPTADADSQPAPKAPPKPAVAIARTQPDAGRPLAAVAAKSGTQAPAVPTPSASPAPPPATGTAQPTVASAAAAAKSDLSYIPSDASLIAVIRVADLVAAPIVQQWLAAMGPQGEMLFEQAKDQGFDLRAIQTVTLGVALDKSPVAPVAVIRSRQPLDAAKLRSLFPTETKPPTGGPTYYTMKSPEGPAACLYLPDGRTAVVAYEPTLQQVLTESKAPANHDPTLTAMLERVGAGRHVVLAASTRGAEQRLADLQALGQMAPVPNLHALQKQSAEDAKDLSLWLAKLKTVGLSVDLAQGLEVHAAATARDAAAAAELLPPIQHTLQQAKTALDDFRKKLAQPEPPEGFTKQQWQMIVSMRPTLETLTTEAGGIVSAVEAKQTADTVEVTANIPQPTVVKVANAAQQLAPMLMGLMLAGSFDVAQGEKRLPGKGGPAAKEMTEEEFKQFQAEIAKLQAKQGDAKPGSPPSAKDVSAGLAKATAAPVAAPTADAKPPAPAEPPPAPAAPKAGSARTEAVAAAPPGANAPIPSEAQSSSAPTPRTPTAPPAKPDPRRPSRRKQIEAKLDQRDRFSLHKVTLTELADRLKRDGIPVTIDQATITAEGLSMVFTKPLDFEGRSVKRRDMLRQILVDIRLDFAVEDDEVVITTRTDALRRLLANPPPKEPSPDPKKSPKASPRKPDATPEQ